MKVVVLFFFCSLMYGQKLHHQMLSAQGGVATTSKGFKVSQTIAQKGVIGTSATKKAIVSQGFQQSKISNAAIVKNDAINTLVYPNPVEDIVNFKFSAPVEGKIAVSIFDIHGRLLLYQEKEAEDNILTITNLLLAAGEYFVKLDGNRYSFVTTILKSK
ncbi:T9SS type A sorting domain-containing protein [Flavobacterium sp.]|uniref:T9SS type A sorting domain-containing protein n=1 Tax=Flavobacterium sp. TaxID=239 RepID=UPI00286F7403|nr:T9SS type A sorting domain-containing protein [Flavobacterium sp.]